MVEIPDDQEFYDHDILVDVVVCGRSPGLESQPRPSGNNFITRICSEPTNDRFAPRCMLGLIRLHMEMLRGWRVRDRVGVLLRGARGLSFITCCQLAES
jgi:hypothetical protein